MLQRTDARAILQHRQQALLHLGRGHGPDGLVAPQVVEEELAQTLAVELAHGAAAFVELVHHAPGPLGRLVGPTQVGVAQAVLAQVLPGAAQHHHAGAAARVLGVERGSRLLRQLHAALDELGRGLARLAGAAGVGRRGGQQQRRQGERGEGNGATCHGGAPQRRSLCSRARPRALGTKASTSPATDSTTPVPITLQVTTVPTP